MDYQVDYRVDLDPAHSVIRLTVTAEIVTLELAEDIYRHLSEVTSQGGPYAAIFDLSGVKRSTIPAEAIKSFALRAPAVPEGRTRVEVAKEPSVYGLARMFQLYRDFMGGQYQVVHSLEQAYDMIGVRPEDFTECLIWPREWVSRS
jgi:hypothetical protein